MNNLYKQVILELYQDQSYRGTVENPSFLQSYTNPLCGDTILISCLCRHAYVEEIRFVAGGCVLSQAAGAFVVRYSNKKHIAELSNMTEDFMQQQLSVVLGPTRLRCIMLPVDCLLLGLEKLQKGTDAQLPKDY